MEPLMPKKKESLFFRVSVSDFERVIEGEKSGQ